MIIRTEHNAENPFVMVSKDMLGNPKLSAKAKGVLSYLLGHPDHWVVYFSDLLKHFTEGKTAIRSALGELRKQGYAKLEVLRDAKTGHVQGRQIIVFERPFTEGPVSRPSVNPTFGKPATSNIDKGIITKRNCQERVSLRSTDAPDGQFFGMGEEASPFIKTASAKLEDFIRTSHKINKHINRSKWHKEMGLLLVELGKDKNRLRQVLTSYIKTPHTKFTPVVESAASFRSKFIKVEAWVNAFAPPPPKSEYSEIIVKRTVIP